MQRRDFLILTSLAALVSVFSFLYFFRHDQILLSGDAVAHINIARRVFDSLKPGPIQLGTVWLPLPHVLILPFIVPDWAWRTGAGASVISMVAFVLGALGIFRLVSGRVGRTAAWLATLAYVANPNLIYLQTTALTEPLYLALFIWSVVFLSEFFDANRTGDARRAMRSLRACMLVTIAMMLTRYDGWFTAAVFAVVLLAHAFRHRHPVATSPGGIVRNFALPVVLIALLWFAYNYVFFDDALAFARGPYSARAIAARTASSAGFTHPGDQNVAVASLYFLKAAQLNLGEGAWGRGWLLAAFAGSLAAALYVPAARILLLLWIPLPFYALSIAYGGAPVFLPAWWPFSYYNLRYGLELLPAIAVFSAILFVPTAPRWRHPRLRLVPLTAAVLLLAGSYISGWRSTAICLREARANSASRIPFERKLADELTKLPRSSTILMYTGDHVGALQRAGIQLKRTINETLASRWQNALQHPAQSADFVVAMERDPVWQAVETNSAGLQEFARVVSAEQPTAVIYKASPSPQ